MPPLPPAIFLMGPTASGKTALAVALAQQLPVELISVDSALIYRGLDIGAAKPDAATLAAAPHHLIDILPPTASYSAADFRRDALALMAEISARGRTPLLVGGTMLYYNTLQHGIHDLPGADAALRAELDADAARDGWPALHARLAQLDPQTAARLQPGDSQRVQRALEVCLLSGQPMSTLLAEPAAAPLPYRLLKLALLPSDRAVLHRRIAERFDLMLEAGLERELRQLRRDYPQLDLGYPAMRCVGYRQMWQYLEGDYDWPTLRDKGIVATRQLAKRQLTWLRGMNDVVGVDCLDAAAVAAVQQQVASWLAAG